MSSIGGSWQNIPWRAESINSVSNYQRFHRLHDLEGTFHCVYCQQKLCDLDGVIRVESDHQPGAVGSALVFKHDEEDALFS